MFCPTCRSSFHEQAVLDPYLRGYACENRHVFYTTMIEHAGGIPTADTVQPPALSDDVQILKFWLTDRHARERVPTSWPSWAAAWWTSSNVIIQPHVHPQLRAVLRRFGK